MEKAEEHSWQLVSFSVFSCIFMSLGMSLFAPVIPMLYATTAEVRWLASKLIWVASGSMPVYAFATNCYFTLRSGGKAGITLIFDCVFSWVVSLPLAYTLVTFTGLDIVPLYLLVQMADILKCLTGFIMMKKRIWIHNIVASQPNAIFSAK